MKAYVCEACGSGDLYEENGFVICRYCGTRHRKTSEDIAAGQSSIELRKDISDLLQKCKEDPSRVQKYAQLILEIDPNNKEAINLLKSTRSEGCYIATAAYGSYDCPQVWTLRRFRDYSLANTWYGRTFIRVYYATSPTLVKWFGQTVWIKELWKSWLDRMVMTLNEAGFEDTPYEDRHW